MVESHYPFIIIGGSITAYSAIKTFREFDKDTRILLVSGEDRLPYKRTKINKHIIRGFDKEEFRLADEKWYAQNNVDLLLDWVVNLNPDDKTISTKGKHQFTFGRLLIATGATSVIPQISGLTLNEYHKVQNAIDVEKLIATSKEAHAFLIIGAGVEGIETADQLVRKGKKVVIVNRLPHPMQKLFPASITDILKTEMKKKEVEFIGGINISSVHKNQKGRYEVVIKGQSYVFDALVACAGAIPNITLATEAGLETDRGIVVNKWLQTSHPHIYAAGDVSQHPGGYISGLWHAAEYQGKIVAQNVNNYYMKFEAPPFRLKTEVFNLFLFSAAYESVIPDEMEIINEEAGDVQRIFYFKDDKLKAAVMINDGERAKTYQLALMEEWSLEKIKNKIPLQPPMAFSFSPSK
ncbi:MAG: FAD-dependent oxidoreductase [Marinilabiliaceae bacterium]|nr:FAD-dependent oxidoreductase [Marinilabiliaceae bacterium]